MEVQIRKASDEDLPTIELLTSEIFPNLQLVPDSRDAYFLALEGGTAVGFVHVRLPKEDDGKFTLQGLGVQQAHRHKGIGSMLLEAALSFCSEQGALEVRLTVRELNPAAGLYSRFGFFPSSSKDGVLALVKKPQT